MKPIWKILVPILVVALLAFAFWYGGDAPDQRGWEVSKPSTSPAESVTPTEQPPATTEVSPTEPSVAPETAPETTIPPVTTPETTASETEPTPETSAPSTEAEETTAPTTRPPLQGMGDDVPTDAGDHPAPLNPEDVALSDTAYSCTLTVRCDTILQNMDWLDESKVSLVPEDGVLYATQTVTFYEGESVFNLLLREMKLNKIHMEFTETPLYNSAYIEGIGNLYAYDCGEQSGWVYRVNGWTPNYGSSRYALQDGDVIEWLYTCSLGADLTD